jgi:hypothetical protein
MQLNGLSIRNLNLAFTIYFSQLSYSAELFRADLTAWDFDSQEVKGTRHIERVAVSAYRIATCEPFDFR